LAEKTLLETVRNYGIFEVKEVIEATGMSRAGLQKWLKERPELLRLVLLGIQADKQKKK
jgi:hypothetical protein